MVLNYIWIGFFLVAFVVAICQSIFAGNYGIWTEIMNASFAAAKNAFDISLGLTGVLALWLGLMKVGERAGLVAAFARLMSPLFSRLFPGIPKGHPALGSMFMNISANMLGLDNAATPLGIAAMKELEKTSQRKGVASDEMAMLVVLNTASLQLIPTTTAALRLANGSTAPMEILPAVWLASSVSILAGILTAKFLSGRFR